MREIKFRMWSNDKKSYFYDILIVLECLKNQMLGYVDYVKEGYRFEQFTGLKDKNGVEIYEGDIVCIGVYSYIEQLLRGKLEVVYSENRASFVFKHLEGNLCYSSLDELTDIKDFYVYEFEVVGNIHEVTP